MILFHFFKQELSFQEYREGSRGKWTSGWTAQLRTLLLWKLFPTPSLPQIFLGVITPNYLLSVLSLHPAHIVDLPLYHTCYLFLCNNLPPSWDCGPLESKDCALIISVSWQLLEYECGNYLWNWIVEFLLLLLLLVNTFNNRFTCSFSKQVISDKDLVKAWFWRSFICNAFIFSTFESCHFVF